MSCGENTNKCDGCQVQLGTECIFYKSSALDCLSVSTGTSLEDILKNINSLICELTPSARMEYVVQSGDDNLTVVTTVDGTTTTFTITLSVDFLSTISSIETSISDINAILADLPITIDTDTPASIEILHPSANTWKVNYLGSSPNIGGVLYSDLTQLSIANQNSASLVRRKHKTFNYITDYGTPQVGDIIRAKTTFQVPSYYVLGANGGRVSFAVGGDPTGVSNSAALTYIDGSQSNKALSFIAELEINVLSLSTSATNAVVSGKLFRIDPESFSDYDYISNPVSTTLTQVSHMLSFYCNIDWSQITFNTYCSGAYNPLAISAKNDLFTIELIKKI